MTLSVIVPVYNEEATLGEVLRRVLAAPPGDKEVLVVDDGSTDGTAEVLRGFADRQLTVLSLPENRGKGAAVREGLKRAVGEYVLIQDGDLELRPEEYPLLLEPIAAGRASVVYGSRFLQGRGQTGWWHYLANQLLTGWANLLYGSSLTDLSTAYKLFPRRLVERLDLRAQRFEFCAEITAKLLRLGLTPEEVPVTYVPRSAASGKKVRYLSDGLKAVWTLVRWWAWRPGPLPAPVPCVPPVTREV